MASPKGTVFCVLLVLGTGILNVVNMEVKKAYPKDNDYLLQNIIKPLHYDLELKLPQDFETSGIFFGTVKIDVQLTDEEEKIAKVINEKAISLHVDTNWIKISKNDIILYERTEPTKNLLNSETFTKRIPMQMISIEFVENIILKPKTIYVLEIKYMGEMPENGPNGFYRSSYVTENGDTQWVAATQFKPIHARKAFPCFDEPKYKATFRIAITHPAAYHALSNTDVENTNIFSDTTKTTFKSTPKMSTYVVGFLVSKYANISEYVGILNGDLYNSAWSPTETINSTKYAHNMGASVLHVMEMRTQTPYFRPELKKLDQASIPHFSVSDMESWGFVTYPETSFYFDPNKSSIKDNEKVDKALTHNLAHMWFGNLVTLKWWDSTWLNEGFARYYEYYVAAYLSPWWQLDRKFVIEQHQAILNSDALSTSVPLTSPAFSPEQISDKFSSITYSKGASIIRMMQHFLGTEYFNNGIKRYLQHNELQNTEPKDLWDALYDNVDDIVKPYLPSQSLEFVMKSWTEKPGFPLVTVSKGNNSELIFQQEQFFFDAPVYPSNAIWQIPISLTTSDKKQFGYTRPNLWLTKGQITDTYIWREGMTWIIVNLQDTAFIRVNYDDILWNGIQEALEKDDYFEIHILNRAQIIDDVMNLARAKKVSYKRALDLVSYLKKELNYFPWSAAFNAFAFLRDRYDSESEVTKLLNKYISVLIQNLYNSAIAERPEENANDIDIKVLALTWACQIQHENCVDDAVEKFSRLKGGVPVDPNLQSIVYCTALRYTNSTDNWNYLWKKFTTTTVISEASTILTALGCSKNKILLNEYLLKSVEETSKLRNQDPQSVFRAVISGSSEGVSVGLDFLIQHHPNIVNRYGGMKALRSVITELADRLTLKTQVRKLEYFVSNNQGVLKEILEAANLAIESAKANLKWAENNREQLLTCLKDQINGGDDSNDGNGGKGAVSVNSSFITFMFSIIFAFIYRL